MNIIKAQTKITAIEPAQSITGQRIWIAHTTPITLSDEEAREIIGAEYCEIQIQPIEFNTMVGIKKD
jgi:hypothetical protein